MVANPFSRGLAEPVRPAPAKPRPVRPYDPTRRRPLPRVEPLRPTPPPRPSGPLFPGTPKRPVVPFGRPVIAPIPAVSRWWLLKFGLRALPWLNLALTAYDLWLLYNQWQKPAGATDCGRLVKPYPQYLRYYPRNWGCFADQPGPVEFTTWSPSRPVLIQTQPRNFPTHARHESLWWKHITNPEEAPEVPKVGFPEVALPLPPVDVPFPYPFAPTPLPNLPYSPSRPREEQDPSVRPRPDSPLLPDPFLPGVPPTEPGPGVQPEPFTPPRPIDTRPRPHPNSPTPEWPFPGIPPEVVPGPWPEPYPGTGPRAPDPNNPNLPGVVPSPKPSIDIGGSPGGPPEQVTPEPGLHYPIPTPRPERERKRRFKGKQAAMWNKLLEQLGGTYMEFDDFVGALYKGIPWKYRRWRGRDGVWRDRDITSDARALRIWEYFEKYNITVGLTELAKMWATDKAIGAFGRKLKKQTRDLGDKGLYSGASGLGRGTPLSNHEEEARKKTISEKYEATKKDREYWKYIDMGSAGWFKQKRLRPDTEIPWFRRETRHVGSSSGGQSYNKRGRDQPYYTAYRGNK